MAVTRQLPVCAGDASLKRQAWGALCCSPARAARGLGFPPASSGKQRACPGSPKGSFRFSLQMSRRRRSRETQRGPRRPAHGRRLLAIHRTHPSPLLVFWERRKRPREVAVRHFSESRCELTAFARAWFTGLVLEPQEGTGLPWEGRRDLAPPLWGVSRESPQKAFKRNQVLLFHLCCFSASDFFAYLT